MSKTTLAIAAVMLSSSHIPHETAPSRVLAAALARAWRCPARASEAPKAAPRRTRSHRHLGGDPATLDPIDDHEELGLRVEDLIFRPLVGMDKERRFVPALAASWAASSDGLVYDFRLDPKAQWEDGSPVTSDDVAFTIDRVRDPKVPAVNWKPGFEDVASVETPDTGTVIVRFRKPYARAAARIHDPDRLRGRLRARPSEVDRKPVGTGPTGWSRWIANQTLVASPPRRRSRERISRSDGRLPHHPRQRRAVPGGLRGRPRRVPRHARPGRRGVRSRRSSRRRTGS